MKRQKGKVKDKSKKTKDKSLLSDPDSYREKNEIPIAIGRKVKVQNAIPIAIGGKIEVAKLRLKMI